MARAFSRVFRFRELAIARTLFQSVDHPTRVTRPFCGAQLHLDLNRCDMQKLVYLIGDRIITEQQLVRRYVKPGMRVLDVGANIGYYLLLFEELVGPRGEVICVEPSPENLPELRANIANNGFSNVLLHEVAVGASEGTAAIKSGINSGVATLGDGAVRSGFIRV